MLIFQGRENTLVFDGGSYMRASRFIGVYRSTTCSASVEIAGPVEQVWSFKRVT